MELLKVDTLEEALEKLEYNSKNITPETEIVPIEESFGRVLAADIICGEDLPGFCRSTVDGYAVAAADTQGAGETMPVFLNIQGQVEMGENPHFELKRGECAYVPTGAMIPSGADSMIMEEYCEKFIENGIAVYRSIAAGDNIVQYDEDVSKGKRILEKGRKIKPQDMGLLASAGYRELECYKPWSIYIISTGDELVSPDGEVGNGKVRDANTYGLIGLAKEMGFRVEGWERISDVQEKLVSAICRGKERADLVVVSGGSSKGKKDNTAKVMDKLSSSGIFTRGIAIKPGKPTILAVDDPSRTIMIGLPGHPMAALTVFRQMTGELWKRKTGEREGLWTIAKIDTNLPSSPGRSTYQLVKFSKDKEENVVTPLPGKSALIYTMSKADGYVVIDRNSEGLKKGELVKVYFI